VADLSYVEENNLIAEMEDNRISVTSQVAEERNKHQKNALYYGLPATIFLSCVYPAGAALWVIFFLFFLVYSFTVGSSRVSAAEAGDAILRHGATGELAVLETLKDLDNEYVILNQVLLPDSRTSTGYREIDYVVCGPNGIWVLEAKSYKGHLTGNEYDNMWTLHKVGRCGTAYTSECRNPAKQVKTYIHLLSEALKAKGERAWLNGIVVLARDNDLSDINVQSCGIVQVSDLVGYLRRFEGKRVNNPKKVATAVKAISSSVNRTI